MEIFVAGTKIFTTLVKFSVVLISQFNILLV